MCNSVPSGRSKTLPDGIDISVLEKFYIFQMAYTQIASLWSMEISKTNIDFRVLIAKCVWIIITQACTHFKFVGLIKLLMNLTHLG